MAYDGTLRFDTGVNTQGFQKDASKLGDIVKGLGVFKIIEKGLELVTSSIDKAVSRYDTLNRFPKIMAQMGFSAEDTGASIKKLSDGIQGLPTSLDQIVGSTQRIASMTGDLVGAADTTLALNNAFLASGASSDAAARGMEQYMQIIGRGKPEMEDWKTLQETMPYALQKVAESFGFAGTAATRDFYAALQSGEITVEQMNARFVELSTAAGGFAETAKTATGGIGTAFTNMNTSIVRGVAAVIESIDDGFSQTRFKGIENIIVSTGKGINTVLQGIAKVAGFTAKNIEPLTVGVISFGVAWKGLQLLSYTAQLGSLTKALGAMTPVILKAVAAKVADKAETIALHALYVKDAVLKGASTTATIINTAAENGNVVAIVAKTVAVKIATVAQWAWNAAMMANPIGLIIAGVIALTTAIVGLVMWLSSGSKEYKKQKEEVEALADAQEELKQSTEDSTSTFETNTDNMEANAKVAKNLVGKLRDVSNSSASAEDKHRRMANTVKQLNATVDGLNIAYDKETGNITNLNTGQEISIEQLEELVSAKAELAQANAWQERANELVKEQVNIQEELAVIEAKKQEIMANSNPIACEQEKLIKELDEAAEGHATTMADVEMRLGIVNDNIAASNTAAAESVVADYARMEQAITENGESIDDVALRWGVSVESIKAAWADAGGSFDEFVTNQDEGLAEYQESVASHTDNIINSFKEIPAEFEMSAQEMIDTLRTNRERYAEWKQAMVEISGQVSAETIAELEKLGPGALSAINQMRENGGAGLREFDAEVRATLDDSTGYASQVYNDPAFVGAPSAGFDAAAQQVAENTALTGAVTDQMEGAKAAAEAVDFSEVGQNIAADIVDGLNSADVTGAMQDITAAISNNTGRVTSAVTSMSTAVQTALRTMKTQAVSIATQMMTEINSAVVSRANTVKASVTSMANGVITSLNTMKTQAANVTMQMMTEINSNIVSRTATVRSSATAAANSVVSGFQPMVPGAAGVAEDMMDGIGEAMDRKAPSLCAKAREIANRIASIMADALDVHSPSRVMIRLFENVMMGVYVGMDGMSGMLYREAESIADGITERLTISPDVANGLVERMRAVTDHTPLGGSTLVPQLAYAGAGGAVQYTTSLTQNITTPKPLSPSEMTREGQDLLRRSRWQLP